MVLCKAALRPLTGDEATEDPGAQLTASTSCQVPTWGHPEPSPIDLQLSAQQNQQGAENHEK